jgi:hypothetical protein
MQAGNLEPKMYLPPKSAPQRGFLQNLLGGLGGLYGRFDDWAMDGYLPGGAQNPDQRIASKKNIAAKKPRGLMDKPSTERDDVSVKTPLDEEVEGPAAPAARTGLDPEEVEAAEASSPMPRVRPPQAQWGSEAAAQASMSQIAPMPPQAPAASQGTPDYLRAPQSQMQRMASANDSDLMGMLSENAAQSQNPITQSAKGNMAQRAASAVNRATGGGAQRDPFNNPMMNAARSAVQQIGMRPAPPYPPEAQNAPMQNPIDLNTVANQPPLGSDFQLPMGPPTANQVPFVAGPADRQAAQQLQPSNIQRRDVSEQDAAQALINVGGSSRLTMQDIALVRQLVAQGVPLTQAAAQVAGVG